LNLNLSYLNLKYLKKIGNIKFNFCTKTNQNPQMYVERRLKPTWDWILTVMDATEAQLRFGASLTDSADSAHPLHPHNSNSNTAAAAAPSSE
jgi:hypothetical protein